MLWPRCKSATVVERQGATTVHCAEWFCTLPARYDCRATRSSMGDDDCELPIEGNLQLTLESRFSDESSRKIFFWKAKRFFFLSVVEWKRKTIN